MSLIPIYESARGIRYESFSPSFNKNFTVIQKPSVHSAGKVAATTNKFPWKAIFFTSLTTLDIAATTTFVVIFAAALPLAAIGTGIIGGTGSAYLGYRTFIIIFAKDLQSLPQNNYDELKNPKDHISQTLVAPLPLPRDKVLPPLPPRDYEVSESSLLTAAFEELLQSNKAEIINDDIKQNEEQEINGILKEVYEREEDEWSLDLDNPMVIDQLEDQENLYDI